MSTRATFLLSTSYDNKPVCFYVHSDNYPSQAAQKFYEMHQIKNERGGFAARFMRGVESAEFTRSHQAHGDTEYRYTLEENGFLKAWKRKEINSSVWKMIFQGQWYAFVNKFSENIPTLYEFNVGDEHKEVMTLNEARLQQTRGEGFRENRSWISKATIQDLKRQIDAILNKDPSLRETLNNISSQQQPFYSVTWTIEDVKELRPDFTDEQASHVLEQFIRRHDCSHDREILDIICDDLYPDECG